MKNKLRVLWFEISIPNKYYKTGNPTNGWQDSLEEIVRKDERVELYISFEGKKDDKKKVIDGVTYIPIVPKYSYLERLRNTMSWEVSRNILIPMAVKVVEEIRPDIIQVFGSEWCWGQVQLYTNIPVVIHMQGSIPPYYNARLPPNYSELDIVRYNGLNLRKQLISWMHRKKYKTWVDQEIRTLRSVRFYMGRTEWDKAIVSLYNSKAKYFYCSEALRPAILNVKEGWKMNREKHTFRIITTGVSTFWKGADTILRTAILLKKLGFNFEWHLCGVMYVQNIIEYKEKNSFEENNVRIHGFVNSDKLVELLLESDLYVHTAYIDNSPNAICEAQYLGMPIIATYVGGVPSLIEQGKDGVLIPANDPFMLAEKILQYSNNMSAFVYMGKASRNRAMHRHSPINITNDLFSCYQAIIEETDV